MKRCLVYDYGSSLLVVLVTMVTVVLCSVFNFLSIDMLSQFKSA